VPPGKVKRVTVPQRSSSTCVKATPCFESLHLFSEVVAQEIDLVGRGLVSRVERDLGRGHRKDQPSATRVDAGQTEHIAKEGAVGFSVVRENLTCAPKSWDVLSSWGRTQL